MARCCRPRTIPTSANDVKRLATLGLLTGLTAAILLVAWQGVGTVGATLVSLGASVLLLPPAFLPSLVLVALSWQRLFVTRPRPRLPVLLHASWVGDSVNTLLPTASIGGEVVKARLLAQSGTPGVEAAASVVVDKTVQAIAIVLQALIGVLILVTLQAERGLVLAALATVALLAAGVAGFIMIQRAGGVGFLAGLLGRLRGGRGPKSVIKSAATVDETIRALYRRPGPVLAASALRLLARLALTLEVWLAAYLLGQPITLLEALMLKSLAGALRGAAFVVPGGWGLQEGSFVLLGGLLGLGPGFMLALSLATRARELLVSLPGLLAWQHAEGRALWKRAGAARRR
jgi:putative membrane protein